MKGSLRIGRLFGISLQLHYSWFIIFALITYGLASSLYDEDTGLWVSVTTGILTSILLFASVVAHELAHSLVAIKNGIPVKSITLFFLGGMAQITREAARPKTELLVALAGPACSLLLAGIFGLVWVLVWGNSYAGTTGLGYTVYWLAWINLLLALFNLIPGFPLDGGRVLRAVIWQRTGDYKRASRIASLVGRGVGYLLIAAGIIAVFSNVFGRGINPLNGIWLAVIGLFLHQTAAASYRQVELRESLRSLKARSVMVTDYLAVYPNLSLRAVVQGYVLPVGGQLFVVAADRRLLGMVSPDGIRSVPQSLWDATPVSAVMVPASKLLVADPEEETLDILERMEENGIGEMPVVMGGVMLGIVVRQRLLHLIRLRSELGV